MTSRRMVLKTGAALPLFLALQRAGLAGESGALRRIIAVIDERLPESTAFFTEVIDAGAMTLLIRGDVTPVWMHLMSVRHELPHTALVGFTTEQSLFCLDQMTRSEGLRIVHRGSVPNAATALRRSSLRPASLPLQHGPALRETAGFTSAVCWAIARPTGDLA